VKRFTNRVRYTGRQSKSGKQSKQGKGRRIVVVQAEVRSTSNHINQEEALIARNTRNSGGKTRTIPYNNNLQRCHEKQENKDYIYTQATDNEGQVRTIKAGQTKTQVD